MEGQDARSHGVYKRKGLSDEGDLPKKKKKMKYRTKNKNMERKKGNSIPFYVRTACSGKLVISLVYT